MRLATTKVVLKGRKGFLEARYNKGRAEGKEEANRENACKMKALNMPDEIISQITGLSMEEIEKL